MRSPAGPAAVTPTEIGQSKLLLRSRCASSIRQPRGSATCASAWPPEASHAVWSSRSPTREHPLRPRRGPATRRRHPASAHRPARSRSAHNLRPRHHRQPPHLRVPRHPGHPQRSQAEHRSPGKIAPARRRPRQLHPARRAESQITHPVHPSFHWLFLMAASCRHSSSAPSRRYAVLSSTIFPPSNSTDCSEPSS